MWVISKSSSSDCTVNCVCVFIHQVQVMSWSVSFGGRMTFAKLLLPFLILHSFCEGKSSPIMNMCKFVTTRLIL